MLLDFNPNTDRFFARVPRREATTVQNLMVTHGFDMSLPASTAQEAVLFTDEPHAAVTFFDEGTERAKAKLAGLHKIIQASWAPTSNRNIRVPADKELWGFQKASLDYALTYGPRTMIADQPGLGKTPQAIAYANEIRAEHVLCIVPASVRLQWAEKIYEWSTMPWPINVHVVANSRNGINPFANWIVISYEMAANPAIATALCEMHFDLLVLDEAHFLKTTDARRTRAVLGGGKDREFPPLMNCAEHILALTGTPLPNRPREAYTLGRGLCWDAFDWMSEDAFFKRFNPSMMIETKTGKKRIDERTGRTHELQNRLRGNFMTRHLKRDVMTQLQYPLYDLVYIDETAAIRAALKAESLLKIDPEQMTGADMAIMGHVAVVRRMMGEALAPGVSDYVAGLLDGGEDKVVVMGWHISVLDIIQTKLERYGVARVDGRHSTSVRRERVKAFCEPDGPRVFLGNMQAAGVGTDGLQHGTGRMVVAEPSWTPSDNEQAVGRLDRGGQTRQVLADICVARGSFAERICATFLRKAKIIDKALDARHTIADW